MTKHQLPKQLAGLSRLVQVEWEARQAPTTEAIHYIAVNDTHRLISYDHALAWSAREGRIETVSGGLKIEPQAAQIVWFGKLAKYIAKSAEPELSKVIEAQTLPKSLAADYDQWIEHFALWVPLTGPANCIEGGLIVLRSKAFIEAELRMLSRLGNAYGSALTALKAPVAKLHSGGRRKRFIRVGIVICAIALLAVRLPMSVLAEARVSPLEPKVVSAPITGVISNIAIKPNQNVKRGDIVLRFDQTELFSSREVAFKRVAVLRADSQRTEAQAFKDPKARAQITLLRAKLAEGRAELAYAQERLAQTVLRAPATGIALIDDVAEWSGRPVKIGERIMVIADPRKAQLEIDVAVEDALFVAKGAEVEFFLATAPSTPVKARLTRVSYSARLQPDQTTKFIAEAVFDIDVAPPRLGLTGTAKIYGPDVSLAYLLFRKPLAKLRRLLGV